VGPMLNFIRCISVRLENGPILPLFDNASRLKRWPDHEPTQRHVMNGAFRPVVLYVAANNFGQGAPHRT
jgi:hypothetical protein